MPIVIQQAEPFSQSISQGAGAADQWTRDFPTLTHQQDTLANIYMNQARLSAQSGGQTAALAAQTQGQNAQAQEQVNLQGGQQEHQQRMLAQQQSGALGLQAQHFDLQQQLQSSQLSQAENLRLQRLRSGMGALQEQVDAGNLSKEDANALATQLQTGINPLAARQSQAQLQMMELQHHQMQSQAAQQDQLWAERRQYRDSSLQQRLQTMIDPATGDERQFYVDGNGDPHPVDFGAPGPAGARGAGGSRSRAAGGAEGESQDLDNDTLLTHARNLAVAEAGLDEMGKKKPVSVERVMAIHRQLRETMNPERPARVDPAQVRQQLWQEISSSFPDLPPAQRRRMLTDLLPGRIREQQQAAANSPAAREAEATRQATAEVDAATAGLPTSSRQRMIDQARQRLLQPRPAAAAAQTRPQPTPFNPADPATQTPEQRQAVTNLDALRQAWSQEHVPEEVRRRQTARVAEMTDLLKEYGSLAAMPQHEQNRYGRLRRELEQATPQARRPRSLGEEVWRGLGIAGDYMTGGGTVRSLYNHDRR